MALCTPPEQHDDSKLASLCSVHKICQRLELIWMNHVSAWAVWAFRVGWDRNECNQEVASTITTVHRHQHCQKKFDTVETLYLCGLPQDHFGTPVFQWALFVPDDLATDQQQ